MFFIEAREEAEKIASPEQRLHTFLVPLSPFAKTIMGIWQHPEGSGKWNIGLIDESTGKPYNAGVPFIASSIMWNRCSFSKSSNPDSKIEVLSFEGVSFRESLINSNPPDEIQNLDEYQELEDVVRYQRALGAKPRW